MQTSFILWLETRDSALYKATEAELFDLVEAFWDDKDKVKAGWNKRDRSIKNMATKMGISVTALLAMLYGGSKLMPNKDVEKSDPKARVAVSTPLHAEDNSVTMYTGSDLNLIKRAARRDKVWEIREYKDAETGQVKGLIVRLQEANTSTNQVGGPEEFEQIARGVVQTTRSRLFGTAQGYNQQWRAGSPKKIYWIAKGEPNPTEKGMLDFILYMPFQAQ